MSDSFIEFRNITKTFGGVMALQDVSLAIGRGECHALMGENGAGNRRWGKRWRGFIGRIRGRLLLMERWFGLRRRRMRRAWA